MQTKKIIGIALAAAMVTSMGAVSMVSASAAGESESVFTTLGVIGTLVGSWDNDVDMADEDGDGIYTATIPAVAEGSYEFKVRANDDWKFAWTTFNQEENEGAGSTCYPGAPNIPITLDATSDVTVMIDTNDEDYEWWNVSYSYTNKAGEPVTVDTGKAPVTGKDEEFKSFGVIGSLIGTWDSDVDMVDKKGNGIFSAVLPGVEAGSYEFKVRANDDWEFAWTTFNQEENEGAGSTCYPGAPNIPITLDAKSNVLVQIDTTYDDYEYWSVSYSYVKADGSPAVVNVGPTAEQLPKQESQVSQESQASQASQESQESVESQGSTASKTSEAEHYVSKRDDYIYFDNSKTKWDVVYAHWWNSDYTPVIDKLTGEYMPPQVEIENSDGTKVMGQDFGHAWPGTKLEKIGDTDIWQARIPYGATFIIFNSGVKDADVKNGAVAYQTGDLPFSDKDNAGQIYTIDTSKEPKAGGGKYKTKYTYDKDEGGAWSKYEGEFKSEEFGQAPNSSLPSGTESSKGSDTSSKASTPGGTTNTASTTNTTVDAPQTGSVAVAVAFVTIATAALGAVVLAAKKKRDEE